MNLLTCKELATALREEWRDWNYSRPWNQPKVDFQI
jgi:hypothetical protein